MEIHRIDHYQKRHDSISKKKLRFVSSLLVFTYEKISNMRV